MYANGPSVVVAAVTELIVTNNEVANNEERLAAMSQQVACNADQTRGSPAKRTNRARAKPT